MPVLSWSTSYDDDEDDNKLEKLGYRTQANEPAKPVGCILIPFQIVSSCALILQINQTSMDHKSFM